MKLYANSKNRKGKIEGIGDNEFISIDLLRGNKHEYTIYHTIDGLLVSKHGEGTVFEDKGEKKGKIDCGCKKDEFTCREHHIKGKQQKDECIHDWDNYGKCCNCGQWNTK